MSDDNADDEAVARPVFRPEDDGFHVDVLGDDWWATETSWFSFHHAERKLGGWLYTMVRPTIGTVAGGAWVWDDTAALPWEVLYSANYTALQLPPGADLRDVTLPTGVSQRVVEPGLRYAIGFDDPGRLHVDLEFSGVMDPEPLTTGASTFGKASHFDQIGRVSGHIEVAGERIEIDCLSVRDRTWGRRREDRPRRAAYVTAVADSGDGFLAVTRERDGVDAATYGFLRRDGDVVPLASGTRRVERDPEQGWITRIDVEVTDADGRTATLTGHPVSRIIINRHTFIDINSLVRWDLDGVEAWGEDQDMWPVHEWAEGSRRQGRPVTDHELVRRVAAVLRAEVAPATEGARPRGQAFRASAVLNRLARRLELAEAHAAAEQEDRRLLAADLGELTAGRDAPAVVAALDLSGGHKAALARLVDAVHDDRGTLPAEVFDAVLARVRLALRADLDRDLEIAR